MSNLNIYLLLLAFLNMQLFTHVKLCLCPPVFVIKFNIFFSFSAISTYSSTAAKPLFNSEIYIYIFLAHQIFKLAIKMSDCLFPLLRRLNAPLLYLSMRLLSEYYEHRHPLPHRPEGFSHSWTSIMFALLSSEHSVKRTRSLDAPLHPRRLLVDFCNENKASPCTTSEFPQSA